MTISDAEEWSNSGLDVYLELTPGADGLRLHARIEDGRPDSGSFPRAEWLRALRRALATEPGEALGYASPQGQAALRGELAGYLARARGLRVGASDLVVTTGFTQGLGLVARALAARGVE